MRLSAGKHRQAREIVPTNEQKVERERPKGRVHVLVVTGAAPRTQPTWTPSSKLKEG
jgi:hypothetical protein